MKICHSPVNHVMHDWTSRLHRCRSVLFEKSLPITGMTSVGTPARMRALKGLGSAVKGMLLPGVSRAWGARRGVGRAQEAMRGGLTDLIRTLQWC